MATIDDPLEQLDRHLESPSQAWLFGAGISKEGGIPLMYPLTTRVRALTKGAPAEELLKDILIELPDTAHIEHVLSHLGDYATLAERSKSKQALICGRTFTRDELTEVHSEIVQQIAKTVRWGYIPAAGGDPEQIGEPGKPIINISTHLKFIEALFQTVQAGRQERRGPVYLFTTNYDTLLEDALALTSIPYWDGFVGGAVAFRGHRFGLDPVETGARARVVKLHGSIDWHLDDDGRVWRVRETDTYPGPKRRVLIYPQATKYVATQKDPFAGQFDLLRRTFVPVSDDVLVVCGYSYGDDHINQEIEMILTRPESRTVLISFSYEGASLPRCLEEWRASRFGQRIYVATERGLYVGPDGPLYAPGAGKVRDWWTFSGVTKVLLNGAAGSVA